MRVTICKFVEKTNCNILDIFEKKSQKVVSRGEIFFHSSAASTIVKADFFVQEFNSTYLGCGDATRHEVDVLNQV